MSIDFALRQAAEMMGQAESMDIKIYYQGGLKVDTPWPMGALPDPARHILSELKKRQVDILIHLANADHVPDFQLQLEALLSIGIHLAHDPVENIKIHCKPIPKEHLQVAEVLLDSLLRNHYQALVAYLMAYPQHPPVPG